MRDLFIKINNILIKRTFKNRLVNNISIDEKLFVTIPLNLTIAKGLSDPHRIKILDLLYHRDLSVNGIMIQLKKSNFKIAMTTLRHHINVLKKNGLVKITKTKEVKGTLVKYYRSTLKGLFLDNVIFDTIISDNLEIINTLYLKFYKALKQLFKYNQNLVPDLSKTKPICKICKINHHVESILFLILSVVITKVFSKLLKTKTI
ncbi:MAG TPA: winged helix-turn-helix domain-containing protein [Candidatus Nitrosocosmicus sp.]